ncbi:MAG: PIN domain-containing protein [Deltaproteobacteria bacterium]|nr:PIN domain-containing protein [Deltaproteobacteria bacterium]MBW1978966.1 PIN domain-containing protein [Deltaproteobacteria bacterium]MBW2044470.1 PIN domain-containing protein [Deltaproteobacteria bacterium]
MENSKEQIDSGKRSQATKSFGKMLFIIDTYAWVEYFIGSQLGRKMKELFNNPKNKFVTVECCLAELKSWTIRNHIDFKEIMNIVEANSKILPVSRNNWIEGAEIKSRRMKRIRDFGLIDSLLIVKQKEVGGKIVTADRHFKGVRGVEFLRK